MWGYVKNFVIVKICLNEGAESNSNVLERNFFVNFFLIRGVMLRLDSDSHGRICNDLWIIQP